jgi:uncharacterized protein (TIGR02145 family)
MSRLFIFVLLITSFLSAQDEWKLKDGTTIKGEKVDRVGGVYNIELDSGESIIGKIVFEDDKLIRLEVDGKPIELYWKNVLRLAGVQDSDYIRATGEVVGTVVDRDGNEYPVVKIGDQIWMAEDLRVSEPTPPRDGWTKLAFTISLSSTQRSYTYYHPQSFMGFLGYSPEPICPENMHVPTDEDWGRLERTLRQETLTSNQITPDIRSQAKNWLMAEGEGEFANNRTGFSAYKNGRIGFDAGNVVLNQALADRIREGDFRRVAAEYSRPHDDESYSGIEFFYWTSTPNSQNRQQLIYRWMFSNNQFSNEDRNFIIKDDFSESDVIWYLPIRCVED